MNTFATKRRRADLGLGSLNHSRRHCLGQSDRVRLGSEPHVGASPFIWERMTRC
jgi:hypothetical protein